MPIMRIASRRPRAPWIAIALSLLLGGSALARPVAAQGATVAARGPTGLPLTLELVEATIDELQRALRQGLVTSEELVQAYLDRIEAYDDGFPFLNGVLDLDPTALEQARARDRDRAEGRARGPLFGIPVLLKDNIDVAGMPTTAGSLALEGSFPPDDAFLTRKLRAAGAIVIGKATLTEFANFLTSGMPSGYSSLAGYGLNPYDPRLRGNGQPVLTPGGSSSGSGIATSASLVPVAVGTETSGSILSPASENGLVGIKPTLGLISRDGILPITADQDTAGPMARTVTDAAILLGVLAGFDPADPATAPCAKRGNCPGDYRPFLDKFGLVGKRIAVPHFPYWNFATLEQRSFLRRAIRVMEREGAFVDDPREIPRQSQLSARGICVTYPVPTGCSSVLLYGFKHDLEGYLAGLGPSAPIRTLADIVAFNDAHPETLEFGQSIARAANRLDTSPGSADTLRYENDRARDLELFRGALDELFRGPDNLPDTGDEFDAILFPANFGADAPARAGYPSICIPAGMQDPAGPVQQAHPFGITLTGPAFSEPELIAMAYDFEQATHFREPPTSAPPLPSDRFVTR
jgi:amidase